MVEAEQKPRHVMVSDWNYEGMEVLLPLYRDAGVEPVCTASIIFNSKGRIFCTPHHVLDKYDPEHVRYSLGCLPPPFAVEFTNPRECHNTTSDLEVFQAEEGEKYMYMNFIHPGVGHELRISVDEHDMWVVAADGDFVMPTKVQI
jgi:L-ascorbate oxidase